MSYIGTWKVSYKGIEGFLENPVGSQGFYRTLMRQLSKYHKFSFRLRKNFTPAQKGAITRAWKRYGGFVVNDSKSKDRGGVWRVMKVGGKTAKELSGRYARSNRGMIIRKSPKGEKIYPANTVVNILKKIHRRRFEPATELTAVSHMEAASHAEEYGELWGRAVVISRGAHTFDIFFPIKKGETIDRLANQILVYLNPASIHLAVHKSIGTVPYDPDSWAGYRESLMYLDRKIRENDPDGDTPFTGIHASFFNGVLK